MSLCIATGIATKKHPIFAGEYEISIGAEVTRNAVVGAYRVFLYSKRSAKIIDTVVSASDGTYKFVHISNNVDDFFVVTFDQPGGGLTMGCSDTLTVTPMSFVF